MLKILALAAVTVWVAAFSIPDRNRLRVVFCDVGQGDAVLASVGMAQVLIDAGPGDKVLECLARNMPFYDRTIEVVVLTHPQADHLGGLTHVLERYTVLQFVNSGVSNDTDRYKKLSTKILGTRTKVSTVFAGDGIRMGTMKFEVVWPERGWAMAHLKSEPSVLGASSDGTDLNGFSVGGILSFGEFDVLLTGDADMKVEGEMVETGRLRNVEIVKVPHHGSRTGMSRKWLDVVSPRLAVISVGRNNYGHPAEEILSILRDNDIRILRTDVDGEVEIISDGEGWWVKN